MTPLSELHGLHRGKFGPERTSLRRAATSLMGHKQISSVSRREPSGALMIALPARHWRQ